MSVTCLIFQWPLDFSVPSEKKKKKNYEGLKRERNRTASTVFKGVLKNLLVHLIRYSNREGFGYEYVYLYYANEYING